jgi:hypothetical protein
MDLPAVILSLKSRKECIYNKTIIYYIDTVFVILVIVSRHSPIPEILGECDMHHWCTTKVEMTLCVGKVEKGWGGVGWLTVAMLGWLTYSTSPPLPEHRLPIRVIQI